MSNGHELESHLYDQRAENAQWLIEEVGMHKELVARRLGVTLDSLEKLLDRRRHGQPHPDSVA